MDYGVIDSAEAEIQELVETARHSASVPGDEYAAALMALSALLTWRRLRDIRAAASVTPE